MKLKKVIACLFVIILTTATLAGCSKEELALYKLSDELTTLKYTKPVQSEGKIDLELDVLPQEATDFIGDDADVLAKLLDFVQANSLTYTVKSDVSKDLIDADINLMNKETGKEVPLMSVLRNDGTTYVKLDDYIKIIKENFVNVGTEEENEQVNLELDKMFGGLEYMSVSDEEVIVFVSQMFKSALGSDAAAAAEMSAMYEDLLKQSVDTEYAIQKQKLNKQLMDALIKKVYNDYSFDLVKQDGNNYSITLDADNIGTTLFSFADYSLENSEELGETIKEFINNLSVEQYSMLVGAYAVNTINKEMVSEGIDEAMKDIVENKEEYKEAIKEGVAMYDSMFKQYIDGSIIQVTMGKDKNGTYTSEFMAKVKVNDLDTQKAVFDATLTIDEAIKEIAAFTVTAPTENVSTFTEFLQSMPKVMTIETLTKSYSMFNFEKGMTMDTGDVNIVIVDDFSYLPFRKISEMFGEQVEWDNVNRKAYILRGEEKIEVDSILQDSSAYIKTREFEKLGYVVEWDDTTKIITITKY
ncbi:MAG: hypothetical protein CVV02_16555 [Firmicutes bacterium HGW-Firmicutes-7]|nr:MAG: hypothetical protein CVV02_16555 [Firmicutes bacterium HGW-Firmicutes-7]